jgi:peptide deformylase
MAIKKVILIGDPLLRKKCTKVNNFNSPEVKTIKSGLRSTIHYLQKIHKRGSELAVPLIGNTVTSPFVNI